MSSRRRQRNYELLGAPVLLFRNKEAYSDLDLPYRPDISVSSIRSYQNKKQIQARWYYPLDFHRIVAPSPNATVATKQMGRTQQEIEEDSSSSEESQNTDKSNVARKAQPKRKKSDETNVPIQYHPNNNLLPLQQSAQLQDHVRFHLLRNHYDKDTIDSLIQEHRQKDVTFVSVRSPSTINGKKRPRSKTPFTTLEEDQLWQYRTERINHTDPAYYAPFQPGSWMANGDLVSTFSGRRAQEDASPPATSGGGGGASNCLVAFPCKCKVCCQAGTSSDTTWWLLHTEGPLNETIRLSHLALPGGRQVWQGQKFSNSMVVTNSAKDGTLGRVQGLDTGDYVREIVQCSENIFVARGDCYCTIVRIVEADVRNSPPRDDLCLGAAQVPVQLRRVDLRSFVPHSPSFCPRNMTAHPRYGGILSDGRVAVVCQEESHNSRNYIFQYSIGEEEVRSAKHSLQNLQYISDIQYASTHPMVLWSSARSFVRPLPTPDHFQGTPRVGFGTSLFAIDLRANTASFQWSPSAETFSVEGMHTISGLLTDWETENRVFVSSNSAKRTYEIDTRMPCRPVTTWSLPHFSEGPGTFRDKFGPFGCGMLLQKPSKTKEANSPQPVFGVNTTPGATSIHLYQRPDHSPMFHCAPIESVFTLTDNKSPVSVATSLTFRLPDISSGVSICGLASFRIPTKHLFSSTVVDRMEEILDHASSTVCVVTSTTKGDVYVHPLLESGSQKTLAKTSDTAPPGSMSVPIPKDNFVALDVGAPSNRLPLNLTNEYPVPSSAIMIPLTASKQMATGVDTPVWNPPVRTDDEFVEITARRQSGMTLSVEDIQSVQLSKSIVDDQQQALSSTLDCFHPNFTNVQRRQMRLDQFSERTDLTEEVIKDAESSWNAQDYESDDSNLMV